MQIFIFALFMCTGGLGCQLAEGPFSQAERCETRRAALNVNSGPYRYVCRMSELPHFVPEVGR